MLFVRAVTLRFRSARPFQRRRVVSRPLHLTRQVIRSRPLSAVGALGSDVEFEEDTHFTPHYTESLSYALVNAFPDMSMAEALKPLPTNLESLTDDPSLGNPLARLERMGTGWFGVILDFEGVVVQRALEGHKRAWMLLAQEEEKGTPLMSALNRAVGMKAEQAISEVFCWGRESSHVRRLAMRKEALFAEITKDMTWSASVGLVRLLETLKQHNIPIAVCSTERHLVHACLHSLGLLPYVDAVVTAEDVERCAPDPEAYAYAAQQLNRPPVRCVVVGASNQSCEAAHDCGMKCVATAGTQPLYELNASDLVIKQLDELSFMNLKQLFRQEELTSSEETQNDETMPFW